MGQLPLLNSKQVTKALKRLGFQKRRKSKGGHQTWCRVNREGKKRVCTVPLSKKVIPRPTLENILIQAGLSEEEFLAVVK